MYLKLARHNNRWIIQKKRKFWFDGHYEVADRLADSFGHGGITEPWTTHDAQEAVNKIIELADYLGVKYVLPAYWKESDQEEHAPVQEWQQDCHCNNGNT